MRIAKLFSLSALLFLSSVNDLFSETKGKIEVGASYVHIDLIEGGNTVKDIDLPAVRVEAAWNLGKGVHIKPIGMWGKHDGSEFTSAGLSIGICLPVGTRFLVSPNVGVNYTRLKTNLELAIVPDPIEQTFDGWAPYLGLEVTYRLRTDLRLSLSGQYAWSKSDTKVKGLPPEYAAFLEGKSHSNGPAYAAMIEYDFSASWSINAAAAYNESYSREKNGIRGRGAKIGLVRWF